jgi:hypothetical protein
MICPHLGFHEVGSQFSLRWFFQHALAWKSHVPNAFWLADWLICPVIVSLGFVAPSRFGLRGHICSLN